MYICKYLCLEFTCVNPDIYVQNSSPLQTNRSVMRWALAKFCFWLSKKYCVSSPKHPYFKPRCPGSQVITIYTPTFTSIYQFSLYNPHSVRSAQAPPIPTRPSPPMKRCIADHSSRSLGKAQDPLKRKPFALLYCDAKNSPPLEV